MDRECRQSSELWEMRGRVELPHPVPCVRGVSKGPGSSGTGPVWAACFGVGWEECSVRNGDVIRLRKGWVKEGKGAMWEKDRVQEARSAPFYYLSVPLSYRQLTAESTRSCSTENVPVPFMDAARPQRQAEDSVLLAAIYPGTSNLRNNKRCCHCLCVCRCCGPNNESW